MYVFDRSAYEARVKWYREARFGMFLHWGLYSIPARGEWVRSIEEMPEESYMRYFEEFNPSDYNPRAWVKSAKEAGMKYIVLTAKHHDGFCLFDSQFFLVHRPCKIGPDYYEITFPNRRPSPMDFPFCHLIQKSLK